MDWVSIEKPQWELVDPAMVRSQKRVASHQKLGAARGRVSYRNFLTWKELGFSERETLK